MPPSSARLTQPPGGDVDGLERRPTWIVVPLGAGQRLDGDLLVVGRLLENEAMNVPLSSWPDTMTAPSTSTVAVLVVDPRRGRVDPVGRVVEATRGQGGDGEHARR